MRWRTSPFAECGAVHFSSLGDQGRAVRADCTPLSYPSAGYGPLQPATPRPSRCRIPDGAAVGLFSGCSRQCGA